MGDGEGMEEEKGMGSVSTPREVPSNFSAVVAPMLQSTEIASTVHREEQRSIDVSGRPGPQQQTCSSGRTPYQFVITRQFQEVFVHVARAGPHGTCSRVSHATAVGFFPPKFFLPKVDAASTLTSAYWPLSAFT